MLLASGCEAVALTRRNPAASRRRCSQRCGCARRRSCAPRARTATWRPTPRSKASST
jgi:hypothetical protein